MSESLKFIVNNVNKLLDAEYNMISFDSLKPMVLLQILADVLTALEICPSFQVEKSVEEGAMNVMKALQSIKYAPPSSVPGREFREGVATGDPSVMYPILHWLLSNQDKVRELAYLSKYVDKMPIPPEALADPDVQNAFRLYEKIIEDFWILYNENTFGRKTSGRASELQRDIRKMTQDVHNISQRVETQRGKLNNIPNRQGLVTLSKGYRNARLEERSLIKQGKENIEIIKQMEFQLKGLEEALSTRKIKRRMDCDILEYISEEHRVNKIFCNSQLPAELAEVKRSLTIFDKIANDSTPAQDYLQRNNVALKEDVRRLMEEKLTRFSSSDDQLGPFRNQATIISNKKQDISVGVRELREALQKLDDAAKEMEIVLYNLVGGEVLHGDQLKQFISKLRDKSVQYKRFRAQLQGFTAELGIASRTVDVLKSIDPSIDEALLTENKSKVNIKQDEMPETIAEAKQACKMLLNDLENLKASTSQIHDELTHSKQTTEEVSAKHKEIKAIFEKDTEYVCNEIRALKESIREDAEKIEYQEGVWKKTTQEYEKCEYIFTRLLEDLVAKAEASENETYFEGINQKREKVKNALETIEKNLLCIEETKKVQRETAEYLENLKNILIMKLEGKHM